MKNHWLQKTKEKTFQGSLEGVLIMDCCMNPDEVDRFVQALEQCKFVEYIREKYGNKSE
jgi:hypothetical protein